MPLRTVGGVLVGALASPRRSLLVLAAGGAVGLGGATLMQGCETMGGLVATAVQVCVPLIRTLLNLPLPELPAGYLPCGGPVVWEQNGHSVTICFYCSPSDPTRMYVQMDCTGEYYPLQVRRIGSTASTTFEEGVHLEKLNCEEQLLMRARSTYDAWSGRTSAIFDCPNDRMFPDPAGYPTLVVSVDGRPQRKGRDFTAEFGQEITLAGTLDEVAHYAMISGLRELSFRADGALYEVAVNSEMSAMMVFKNGARIDTRFLFAPTP
jgi:hypothetical protein